MFSVPSVVKNRFNGGAGDDMIKLGDGIKTVYGGTGKNTVKVNGLSRDYDIEAIKKQVKISNERNPARKRFEAMLNEIDTVEFDDKSVKLKYGNADLLKAITMVNMVMEELKTPNADWGKALENARNYSINNGYDDEAAKFDSIGYMQKHKNEIEEVFGIGAATEENAIKHYIINQNKNIV